jgi:hypothetical protein
MTTPDFNKVVESQIDRIKCVLVKKALEYNLDSDRLSVFKHGAGISEETPEQVLYGFMLKHIISVTDMINSKETYSEELWNEKITDICNYLILLQGLLRDTGRMTLTKNELTKENYNASV